LIVLRTNLPWVRSLLDRYEIAGVAVCRCPGDIAMDLVGRLKRNGAEAIYFCACSFAKKTDHGWIMEGSFCENIDCILEQLNTKHLIPCVKSTAFLPEGYAVEHWNQQ